MLKRIKKAGNTHQPTFLLVLDSELQCQIWQAALQSQKCSVIVDSRDIDLPKIEALCQGKEEQSSPVILIADVNKLENDNPYAFCRNFKNLYPKWKVILVDSHRSNISKNVRKWAIAQGAAGFLSGITQDDWPEKVIDQIRQVFELIDDCSLDLTLLRTALLELSQTLHSEISKDVSNSPESSPTQSSSPKKGLTYRGKPTYQSSSSSVVSPAARNLQEGLTYRGRTYKG
ncbi:MAG: hypothetical protein AAGD25_37595 [Cyanobacteria bacterium P01_F01_bin.150]